MSGDLFVTLTTVQEPTSCVRRLAEVAGAAGAELVVAGDRRGPASYDVPGVLYLDLEAQAKLPLSIPSLLPVDHYARKNVAYLVAIRKGAGCIYETDDDNEPLSSWAVREEDVEVEQVAARPWLNVFRFFTGEHVWPRGFPLSAIRDQSTFSREGSTRGRVRASIQQGLVQNAPDVDAVWRLILGRELSLEDGPSIWLPPKTWCPFNSQSTWWWPDAYPLLYLPSHCSFRMTDIWRGFVAQRCLWAMRGGLVFHAPEVAHDRNVHDLVRDFEDEVPGYLANERIARELGALELKSGREATSENLVSCYRALVEHGHLPAEELGLVEAWVRDLSE